MTYVLGVPLNFENFVRSFAQHFENTGGFCRSREEAITADDISRRVATPAKTIFFSKFWAKL